MDLTSLLLFCITSLIIGAVLMLLIQYYVFVKFFNVPGLTDEQKSINEKYLLPDTILDSIKGPDSTDRQTSITAFNLIFQFLFHELRNSNKVRKWFYRKLSMELDELISKTTTGKFFDKLLIRDLDLGGHFPEIRNIRVHNAELHPTEGHLESIDLLLDVFYNGNFKISIDADMVLGKKGFLSVKVKHVSGLARLQFTRKPYTHWSLCFLGEPKVEFDVETQFQGRQMQSNVTSIISNQIRKAIRRKHTLPNYKLRYKPFFHKTDYEIDVSDIVVEGNLEINIRQLTRLLYPVSVSTAPINQIYCTLTLATIPWVHARQHDEKTIRITIDLKIHKAKNQQIGIVFKQTDTCVIVDSIIPNTPATKANFCHGDILISIDGKKVSHINHISKIVKNLSASHFMLRIERIVSGILKSDAEPEELEVYEDFNDLNISFSKNSDSVQIGGTIKNVRKNSMDKATSSDSSRSNTPTHTPQRKVDDNKLAKSPSRSLSRGNSETKYCDEMSIKASNIILTKDCKTVAAGDLLDSQSLLSMNDSINSSVLSESLCPVYQQHNTIECCAGSFIQMEDLAYFKLSDNFSYLNLNVFGKTNDDSMLLGYLNISLHQVLAECSDSNLGQFFKQYTLTPPSAPNLSTNPLSSLSGFDANLCYGDILMSFTWTVGSITSLPLNTTPDITKKSTKFTKNPFSVSGTTPFIASTINEKYDDHTSINSSSNDSSRQHDFIRTHFHRSTQCDFCGKKIWLKDAVQCKECGMSCHKKCINKCQNSTICGPVDAVAAAVAASVLTPSVEFKVTDVDIDVDFPEDGDELRPSQSLDQQQHRQSFSDMITQGIKRVNSANNLAIPGIVAAINQGSRSLPPSPQHSPRKQSLVNQSTNPFVAVAQKLEQLPDEFMDISREQISELTEPLIEWGAPDELMSMAKGSSRNLYMELEPKERVEKINILLAKLRVALDSETTAHAILTTSNNDLSSSKLSLTSINVDSISPNRSSIDNNLMLQTKGPATTDAQRKLTTNNDGTRKAFLIGQSEERVQALSVIMLHLCTGLQYAQGVANQ